LQDLAGLRVGLQTGTLTEAIFRTQAPPEVVADCVTFVSGPLFLWQVETGKADAAIVDVAAFDFHVRQNPISTLRLAQWRHPFGFNFGFAMLGRNGALRDAVNAAVGQLVATGRAAEFAAEEKVHYAAPREPMMRPPLTLADLLVGH